MPETDEVKELREEVARLRTQIEQSKPTVVQPWWRKFFRKTHPMATNLFEYRLGVGYVVFGLLTFVSGLWMQGIYAQGSSNIGLQSILDTARTFPVSWWFLEILYILLAGVGIVLTLLLALLWRRFLVSSMILALVGIAPNIVSILSNIVLLSIVTTAQTYGSDSAFIVVSNAMYTLIGYAWLLTIPVYMAYFILLGRLGRRTRTLTARMAWLSYLSSGMILLGAIIENPSTYLAIGLLATVVYSTVYTAIGFRLQWLSAAPENPKTNVA